MAVDFTGSTQGLYRTTSLPSDTNFSACMWWYQTGDGGSDTYYNTIFSLEDSTTTDYRRLYYNQTNDRLGLEWDGSEYQSIISPVTNGAWHFIAVTCAGLTTGDIDSYGVELPDATFSTASNSLAADTFTEAYMRVGIASSTNWMNGRVAALKVWDDVLTEAELYNERWTYRPQITTNLHGWWPFYEDTKDYSGNGKDFTEAGTIAYNLGPPIAWGGSPYIINQPAGLQDYELAAAGGSFDLTGTGVDFVMWYPHVGVAPWSSIWRPGRL